MDENASHNLQDGEVKDRCCSREKSFVIGEIVLIRYNHGRGITTIEAKEVPSLVPHVQLSSAR